MRSRIVRIAWRHPNAFGISGLISPDIFARNEACRCERKIGSVAGSCPATLPSIDTSLITGSVVGVSRERQIPTPHSKKFFAWDRGRPARRETAGETPALPGSARRDRRNQHHRRVYLPDDVLLTRADLVGRRVEEERIGVR